jgi:hypothetical protein
MNVLVPLTTMLCVEMVVASETITTPDSDGTLLEWYAAAAETHCLHGSNVVRGASLGLSLLNGVVDQVVDATTVLLRTENLSQQVAVYLPETAQLVDGQPLQVWVRKTRNAYRYTTVIGAARQVTAYIFADDVSSLEYETFVRVRRNIPTIAALKPVPPQPIMRPAPVFSAPPQESSRPASVGVSPHSVMRRNPSRLRRPGEMSR